jgi:D-lactate dehydrogenase (cytochrome)
MTECVEFLDKKTVQAVNEGGLAGRKFPLQDSLFFKFQG